MEYIRRKLAGIVVMFLELGMKNMTFCFEKGEFTEHVHITIEVVEESHLCDPGSE